MKLRQSILKIPIWTGIFILFAVFLNCKPQSTILKITGMTMGTSYMVKIADLDDQNNDSKYLKYKIDSTLQNINQQMSTYISESEISRFNQLNSKNWFKISPEFHEVLLQAQTISKLTNGAFDITIEPLVKLWGFNQTKNNSSWKPPAESDIAECAQNMGHKNIIIADSSIRKLNPAITIDLNAIAKGFGVDQVFKLLKNSGFTNILVEIGGEVRCSGKNNRGELWQIGIDSPKLVTDGKNKFEELIKLNNQALATSGDYRNYFEYNGKIYSHTIDPQSGYPIENNVTSASVIAPDCSTADALATALMVLGAGGIGLIETIENVETLLLIRTAENTFRKVTSTGWPTGR